jgi:hypothetical protein
MKSKFDNLIENIMPKLDIPNILYHATYKPLLKSIIKKGLGGNKRKNWEDSIKGVVYLAKDPYVAESYAESAEEEYVPDSWLDNIVILQIDTTNLDKSKFIVDRNNLSGDTLEYFGIIPSSEIKL